MNELQVCVVDDDQYYNSLVTKIVEQKAAEQEQEINITSYSNGQECIQSSNTPDLVFLDFYLSTTNDITHTGLDVLKNLKSRNPGTKIVFMSKVHDWAHFKSELIAEGALDFIKKDDNLQESIERILKLAGK